MNRYLILFLFPLIFLTGCGVHTNNPEKCYEYWADGEKPRKDVKPIRAEYWQSPHFTKEYTIYMELAASVDWKEQLIKLNNLTLSDNKELPSDAPAWFRLSKRCKLWRRSEGSNDTICFEDADTGHFFIYDQQL